MSRTSALSSMATYGVGLMLNKGLSLLMLPLMTRYLMPEQIGKLDLLATIGAVSGIVIALSMHEVIYRFAGVKKDTQQRFTCASEIYSCTSIASIIFAVVLFTVINIIQLPSNSLITTVELNLLLLCASFEGILGISTAWLRMQDRAKTFLIVSVCSTAIQVSLVVLVLTYSPSVKGILACSAVTYILQFTALHFINRFKWSLPPLSTIKPFLSYSLPLMLAALIGFGLNGSERFFLAYSTDLETLAWYSVAIKFSFAMCILMQPFGMWWMPKRFQTIEEHGVTRCAEITQFGMVYLTTLTIAVAFSAKAFIALALPVEYSASSTLLIGTLCVAWLKEMSELLNVGILFRKKTQWQLQICLAATLVGLALMWQWSDTGIWGVIFALGVAQFLKMVITFFVSQKLIILPYQLSVLGINSVILAIGLYVAYSVTNPLVCILLAVTTPIITALPLFFNAEFNQLVQATMKRFYHRVGLGA
ncbi:lipopolysaccharide biosynthesis protein [Vibrio profundi]|uniref:lipopolysaccharide biosynthesis protein n=1 Tax=Vibrio profundi TaxID=1774960 RepID=UPI003736FD5A